MFRMKKQEYKEQERHYYFFDYLFWLGEITWEHYHKVSFKQPRGSDMLWACIELRKEAAFVLNIMYFIVLSVIKYDVSCKDNCFLYV